MCNEGKNIKFCIVIKIIIYSIKVYTVEASWTYGVLFLLNLFFIELVTLDIKQVSEMLRILGHLRLGALVLLD